MLTFVKADFAKALAGTLAKNNDRKTTLLGIAAAALIGSQIDWSKLVNGDATALGQAAGAIVAALIGYYTNKPDKPKTA